jgi:hypothetical protein
LPLLALTRRLPHTLTDVENPPIRKGPDKTVLIGIGVGVVLALAIGAFFIFRGKSSSTDGATVSGSASPTGFKFATAKSTGISTTAGADQKKINKVAAPVAVEVTSQLNTLFGEGFVNATNWKAGKYDTALAVFDTQAASSAQQQIDVLTAGSSAGATYSSIVAGDNALNIQVLVDKHNTAISAVGVFKFAAAATAKDGSIVTLQSKGQFIFANVNGTWKVVSFNVTRNDVAASPTTAPTTGSPSA